MKLLRGWKKKLVKEPVNSSFLAEELASALLLFKPVYGITTMGARGPEPTARIGLNFKLVSKTERDLVYHE